MCAQVKCNKLICCIPFKYDGKWTHLTFITVNASYKFDKFTYYMQICDNGIISIGERPFKLWRPQRFPSDNPLIQQANVLAPFWNDHEPNPIIGAVKYQIFKEGPLNRFITHQQHINGFKDDWKIVINWENVSPYSRCRPDDQVRFSVNVYNYYNRYVCMFLGSTGKFLPGCDYLQLYNNLCCVHLQC